LYLLICKADRAASQGGEHQEQTPDVGSRDDVWLFSLENKGQHLIMAFVKPGPHSSIKSFLASSKDFLKSLNSTFWALLGPFSQHDAKRLLRP
jgi:hypothetical protein